MKISIMQKCRKNEQNLNKNAGRKRVYCKMQNAFTEENCMKKLHKIWVK